MKLFASSLLFIVLLASGAIAKETRVVMDRLHGVYNEPFLLSMSPSPQATVVIRYTLDCSEPTSASATITQVSIDKTTVIRAAAFDAAGNRLGPITTQTYIIPSSTKLQAAPLGAVNFWMDMAHYGITEENAEGRLEEAITSLPILSVTTPIPGLFGQNEGIYINPSMNNDSWQRQAHAELIMPNGALGGFEADCGLTIQGGASRSRRYGKHAFRLNFDPDWGDGTLHWDAFGANRHEHLHLRAGYIQSFVWPHTTPSNCDYAADAWVKDTQTAMGIHASGTMFVNLWLDGMFWGLYTISERPDAKFCEQYFGGDEGNWDIIKPDEDSNIDSYDVEAIKGDEIAWRTMFDEVKSPYPDYAKICQHVDIPALIDYMLVNFYAGNADWDWHNWYAVKNRTPGCCGCDGSVQKGWIFESWDAENSFGGPANLNLDIATTVNFYGRPSMIHNVLSTFHEYRQQFADRAFEVLSPSGVMGPTASKARYAARIAEIDEAMHGEAAKWGSWLTITSGTAPKTKSNCYDEHVSYMMSTFFNERGNILADQLKSRDLWPVGLPPILAIQSSSTDTVIATNPNTEGVILATLDGSDPMLPSGAISSQAIVLLHGAPLTIGTTTRIKARVYMASRWTSLSTAVVSASSLSSLRITEIMFLPQDGGVEFIEMKNVGNIPLNMTGAMFIHGISFVFPDNLVVQPGGFVVLAGDKCLFSINYPGVACDGEFSGNLANEGESLSIMDGSGKQSKGAEFHPPWPAGTYGGGYSLVPLGPQWRKSTDVGGSPGRDDPWPAPTASYSLVGGAGAGQNEFSGAFVDVLVSIYPPQDERFSLAMSTENGTAADGEDFVGGTTTIYFDPGKSSAIVRIPLIGAGSGPGPDRHFFINIQAAYKTIVVRKGPTAISDVTATPMLAKVGENVLFFVLAETSRYPISYAWDFGDGTGQSPLGTVTHSFANEGTFGVTVKMTDAAGMFTQQSISVTVVRPSDPPIEPPIEPPGAPTIPDPDPPISIPNQPAPDPVPAEPLWLSIKSMSGIVRNGLAETRIVCYIPFSNDQIGANEVKLSIGKANIVVPLGPQWKASLSLGRSTTFRARFSIPLEGTPSSVPVLLTIGKTSFAGACRLKFHGKTIVRFRSLR